MSAILHIVPGLGERWSGIAVAARLLAQEQNAKVVDACEVDVGLVAGFDEVWVHSTWSWPVWMACFLTIRARKRLVRMTHGNLDPVRLRFHGWKKRLAGPAERYFLRRADRIVATCEAEKGWIEAYLGTRCPPIEVTDIKRFFNLTHVGKRVRPVFPHGNANPDSSSILHPPSLHLLYLGRRHPLKGVDYLETAVAELNSSTPPLKTPPLLKIVSNAFGEEKEKVWEWCDVLVLPTLSENFGLVVAEALERGKRVITTDGAPAWGGGNDYGGRLIYLRGYRDGSTDDRVCLLKEAITSLMDD